MKFTQFDPTKWYWRARDARVFSGPLQSVIQSSDAEYLSWLSAGNVASPWPADPSGAQSMAAMQDVLTPYGMFADLKSYAADARWRKEVGGVTISDIRYPTDRETQSKMTSAFLIASTDPTSTFKWKLADGTWTPVIDATTMQDVARAIGAFVNECFMAEDSVDAEISGGTITTRDQVDAAFS